MKSGVIIRNVSGIVPDEIETILSLIKPLDSIDSNAPSSVKELQQYIINGTPISHELITDLHVRDYLYQTIKNKTGIHFILHLDQNKAENTESYIMEKLNNIGPKEHIDVLYIGGGHGGGHDGRVDDETSGLKKVTVNRIAQELKNKQLTTGAVILGSCYSGSFINEFRPIVIPEGVLLADTVECSESCFKQTINIMQQPHPSDFFSIEEINNARNKTSDLRVKFSELVGMEACISVKQNYIKAHSINEDQYTDVLDQQIMAYTQAIEQLGREPSQDELINISNQFPLIHSHIQLANVTFANQFTDIHTKILNKLPADGNSELQSFFSQIYNDTSFSQDEKNYIKIIEYMTTSIYFNETTEELSDFIQFSAEEALSMYTETDPCGPGIKIFSEEATFYQSIQVALDPNVVTSKVIATPTTHQFMELSSVNRPAHTCLDAVERSEKVIKILNQAPNTQPIVEKNSQSFNQNTLKTTFNTSFTTAMTASQKISEIKQSNKEKTLDIKAKLGKISASAPFSTPNESNENSNPLNLNKF